MNLNESALFKLYYVYLHPLLEKYGFRLEQEHHVDMQRFYLKYSCKKITLQGHIDIHYVDIIALVTREIILCYGIVDDIGDLNAKIKIDCKESLASIMTRFQEQFIYKLLECFSPKLDDLPYELKAFLCKYFSAFDLAHMSQVNSEWYKLCSNERLWLTRFLFDFPGQLEYLKRTLAYKAFSWKNEYRDEFLRMKRRWEGRGLAPPIQLLALPGLPPFLPIGPGQAGPLIPFHPFALPLPDVIPLGPPYPHPNQEYY